MKRGTPCKHCGSPAHGNPCWYAYVPGGADPPCDDDEYIEAIEARRRTNMRFAMLVFIIGLASCLFVLAAFVGKARAEVGVGSWWNTDAVRRCCSEADAVYADEWTVMPNGNVKAKVTGGGPRNHAWAPLGKVYEVPADRILIEPGNPTGRPLLFLSARTLNLYCFARGLEG